MARASVFQLAFLACTIWATMADTEWNQEGRDQILEIHNDYRRNEGGCQINKLEYDMELEAQAKGWAERCVFEHEMLPGRGENLAFNTATDPESTLVTNAAQGWFDEKKDYSAGQHGCQRSCHYTQLVWFDTQKVGCYSHRCPTLGGAGAKNAWYFVCFYTPMGNTIGVEPYKTSCDTPCRNGQTEDNGLCVGEVIVPCVDEKDTCKDWASRGECANNAAYMEKNCRKSCKVCVSDDEEEEESEAEDNAEGGEEAGGEGGSTEGGAESEEEEKCEDENANCVGWAAANQCKVNPGYMLAKCKASCGQCGEGGKPEVPCTDLDPRCAEWAAAKHCRINPGYMMTNCYKSCSKC